MLHDAATKFGIHYQMIRFSCLVVCRTIIQNALPLSQHLIALDLCRALFTKHEARGLYIYANNFVLAVPVAALV